MKVIYLYLILFSLLIAGCGASDNDSSGKIPAPVKGVYFIADKDAYQLDELYVTDHGQTTPRKLSQLPDYGFDLKVLDFKLSPDNRWIAYEIGGISGGTGKELYIVPTTGGKPIHIAGDVFGQAPSPTWYEWAPDSSKLAFTTYHYTILDNLFVTNPDGTETTKVSADFDPTDNYRGVSKVYWSPDSQYIAYTGRLGTTYYYELYIVKPNGSGHQKLSQPFTNSIGVGSVAWSPDAQKLSFHADYIAFQVFELYTVNRDGSAHNKIADNSVVGTITGAIWSPNSVYLAYSAFLSGQQAELYTVRSDGTNTLKVSETATATQGVESFKWSPDSSYLAYIADFATDDVNELYTTKPDGTSLNKVSGTLTSNGDVIFYLYEWSPDSLYLAYVADQDTDSLFEIYTVKPSGLDNIKISGTAVASQGLIEDFSWSPNSQLIGFRSLLLTNSNNELYSASRDGTNLITNSGPLLENRHITSFKWSKEGDYMAYVTDHDTENVFELYTVTADATSLEKISGDATILGTRIKKYQFEK